MKKTGEEMIYIKTDLSTIEQAFLDEGYITGRSTAISLQLVLNLHKPLLIEGPAGVGKTELAKVLARVLETKLIRLQCYEGLDVHHALYEWNYSKQMLHIKMAEVTSTGTAPNTKKEIEIFGEDFLLKRPLLEALTSEHSAPVLLIDEIDRADEEFEAFLLEFLAEFQLTIPEYGTVTSKHPPFVILTSNRTRELSDALRRRCLYQWVDFPDQETEQLILQKKLPEINEELCSQITKAMVTLRAMPLHKIPGIAESIDWAKALMLLHRGYLDREALLETLGCIIKDQEDWKMVLALLEQDKKFMQQLTFNKVLGERHG